MKRSAWRAAVNTNPPLALVQNTGRNKCSLGALSCLVFPIAKRAKAIFHYLATMLILRGSPALSQFRLQKLLLDLTSSGLAVRALAAQFVHVVEVDGDIVSRAARSARKTADLRPEPRGRHCHRSRAGHRAPPGHDFPWSSKATDIAHICGLAGIKRIER